MADAKTQPQTGGVLAGLLREHRERCNARFMEARRYKSRIDGAAFGAFLTGTLAPVMDSVHAAKPDQTAACFEALYALALDLLGQELLGPRSRCPVVEEGWRVLLPRVAPALADEPRKVAGAVSNALYNLAQTPDAQPDAWIERMSAASAHLPDAALLMQAGYIAAWQAGLAHHRADALALLENGPLANGTAGCALLGLAASDGSSLGRIVARMKENPWLTAQAARSGSGYASAALKLVRRVGAFKGFGGDFLAPPCIVYDQGQFVVGDGRETWVLNADAYGATLVKWAGGRCAPRRHAAHGAGGSLRLSASSGHFPEFKTVLSAADDGRTLAVTVPHSHSISLLAAVS